LVLVGLLVLPGCAFFSSDHPSASSGPIDPDWVPVYVDDEVGPPLDVYDLVDTLTPAIVSIVRESISRDMFFQPVPQRGAGTGVIIDPKGYIVTNNHVVEGATKLEVTLSDGRTYKAVNHVGDPWSDLAVISIQAGEELPYAHFLKDSLNKLRVPEPVLAAGNALALPGGPTWTDGIVSYLGRAIQLSEDIVLSDIIQTDAAINPGNSGGPLLNMAGQVVGINTAIAADAEGIGFAISTNTAIPVIYSLIREESVPGAWLGVNVISVNQDAVDRYELSVGTGALIIEVVAGSPAASAGLEALDVIVGLGGNEIKTSGDLVAGLREYKSGDTVDVSIWRGEEQMNVSVVVGQRPVVR